MASAMAGPPGNRNRRHTTTDSTNMSRLTRGGLMMLLRAHDNDYDHFFLDAGEPARRGSP